MPRWKRRDPPAQASRQPILRAENASPGIFLPTLRAETETQLRGYPDVTVSDALLVTDILATDALRSGREIQQVRFYRQFSRIRIELTWAATAAPLPLVPPGTDHGFSRVLLDDLTCAWDVHRDESLQTVWVELTVPH